MKLEYLRVYQENYFRAFTFDYKRYIHNFIDFNDKLIGVIGARGVGKTTFLIQYLKENNLPKSKKLYFSADSIEIGSLFDIADDFEKEGGELLIIDEIHKYPNFEIELKKIYDMLSLKVIFSGSSALKLDHSKADLSRRSVLYRVNGLSFREFLELKGIGNFNTYSFEDILENHIDIAQMICKKIRPFEYWKEYLKYGFYPFYFDNPNTYLIRLKETVNTVIEVDIPSIFPIEYEKIINLKKLIMLVCISEPFKINIRTLAKNIGTSDYQTIYRYLEYLKRGRILNPIRQESKTYTIFSKPKKLYLGNTNLHYAYCHNEKIGTIREVFFASMFNPNEISVPKKGDFKVRDYIFEIGGKNKDFTQIKDIKNSYLVLDDIEFGYNNKIPLWLFGFLY